MRRAGTDTFWDSEEVRASADLFWNIDTRGNLTRTIRQTKRQQDLLAEQVPTYASEMDAAALIEMLEKEMKEAAANLDFEAAARLRDQLFELRAKRETTDRVRAGGLDRIKARR